MNRFVKVHFAGSVRAERHGYFLRVTSDTSRALSGYEVDASGEEVQPRGFERRLRVIARSAIIAVKEYKVDKKYDILVPADAPEME